MTIDIRHEDFDPWQALQQYQQSAKSGQFGATSIFIGTMRDFNDGDTVTAMTLDYYPVMTEKQLAKIVTEASQQWAVLDALIIHRVGEILPNQPIVLVAVWTAHRGDAFDACRYIMEALKSTAPFWKKERLINNQERWVTHNTDGYTAR
jgi:molybdopterin synthase catalytic subunit